jgi:two-component sensor histidine kinase
VRGLARRLAAPKFQGIRFRLGLAMAMALAPVLLVGALYAGAQFQREADERRVDLVLAADRSAVTAKARLDGAVVILETLRPDTFGPYCAARLSDLVQRVDGYEAFYRFSPTGAEVCASSPTPSDRSVGGSEWFDRLKSGEDVVLVRAPPGLSNAPAMLVAVRSERPMGAFDGAVAAVIALDRLQPSIGDRSLPAGTQVALTDAAGNILTATDPSAFQLAGGRSVEGWVERASSTGGLFQARDLADRRRVFAGAALAGRDVYVLLSAPDPGPLSWARLNPTATFLLPLLAWLASLLTVLVITERIIIRWLDYLERVAAIYARGRFNVRPVQAMNAPSEIRVLARTLDEMAETISARDRSLTESLEEKDALMREIHHRVKNNLQIISSLLSMQQRGLTDPAARAAVGDTRQRIAALALIYRTLYQSADLHRPDLADFLRELVGQLIAAESHRGALVASEVIADSLVVDPDKLAAIALWAVEAVSNAQKHAFAGRGGKLSVRFRVNGDESVLEVQDDGPGADTAALTRGVGGTLMQAFARQLRGTVEFVRPDGDADGMVARLTFLTPSQAAPPAPKRIGGNPQPGATLS